MKKIVWVLLFFLFMGPTIVFATEENKKESVTLSKCVDANSARFLLGTTEIKVRFIGIEAEQRIQATEEDETNGKETDLYVCSVLTNAKNIEIEYEPNSEKADKYGRNLVWVHVDGILLQENLVRNGYAKIAYLYGNYLYNDQLKEAEKTAKEKKVGIWKDQIVKTNIEEEKVETKEKKEENFFSILLNFINEIFEKIIEFIDNLIKDML